MSLENESFPRSAAYDDAWVMANPWGANVLWLAEWLSDHLELREGMRVLDLGCGRAKSSVFLAREFGVQVWATDLWIPATENWKLIREAGVEDRVFPIHADARTLPFAEGFFDAIVAVDSYQYYGNDDLYLSTITRLLRDGGQLGFASAGLMREFPGDEIPAHLRQLWGEDTWCVHTLAWWRRHWGRSSLIDLEWSDEMKDGWQHWLQWSKAIDASDWYQQMLEGDAGQYLGYLGMVARKRAGGAPFRPLCPHGCDAP
jgi:SAM-dependent methyltransferase